MSKGNSIYFLCLWQMGLNAAIQVPTCFLPLVIEQEAELTSDRFGNFREEKNISILPGFEPHFSQRIA
jgi:hypothetical protein